MPLFGNLWPSLKEYIRTHRKNISICERKVRDAEAAAKALHQVIRIGESGLFNSIYHHSLPRYTSDLVLDVTLVMRFGGAVHSVQWVMRDIERARDLALLAEAEAIGWRALESNAKVLPGVLQ